MDGLVSEYDGDLFGLARLSKKLNHSWSGLSFEVRLVSLSFISCHTLRIAHATK